MTYLIVNMENVSGGGRTNLMSTCDSEITRREAVLMAQTEEEQAPLMAWMANHGRHPTP